MNKSLIVATLLLAPFINVWAADEDAAPLETEMDKVSYSIGVKYAEGIRRDLGEINMEAFIQGMTDAYEGKELRLSEADIRAAITGFQQKLMAKAQERQQKMQAERKQVAAENLEKGKAFLAANKEKDGVTELESGLQYKVLKQGSGEKPDASDTVKVHYHGTLLDGSVFDSSVERGSPSTFPLNRVIKGWIEGIQLMPVGSKWVLYIPPHLAYGEQGKGSIEPNATLIFEVELLGIES